MFTPHTTQSILKALQETSDRHVRQQLIDDYRSLIQNPSVHVLLYCGQPQIGRTMESRLNAVYTGIWVRRHTHMGHPDGWGNLNEVSQRTTPAEFREKGSQLLGVKDDVILNVFNQPERTANMDVIRKNTIRRKLTQELNRLGLNSKGINLKDLCVVPMPDFHNDQDILNGSLKGQYAITSSCYTLPIEEKLIDEMALRSQRSSRQNLSQPCLFLKVPLFQALSHWGKEGSLYVTSNKQDLTYNFKYPHEWLTTWALASKMLGCQDADMLKLADEVQLQTPHLIDFNEAAKTMNKTLNDIGKMLHVRPLTIQKMQQHLCDIWRLKMKSSMRTR